MLWFIPALLSAITSAFGSITEKKSLVTEHAMEFCAALAVCNLLFAVPLALFADFSITGHQLILLVIIAGIDSIAFLYIAKALRHMDISVASPFLTFGPLFSSFFAFLFLNESLSNNQLSGMFFVIIGAYILELSRKSTLMTPIRMVLKSKYIHYIFIALILYGLSITIGRFLLNKASPDALSPYTFLFFQEIFIAVILFTMISIRYDGFKGVYHGFKKSGKWILITSFFIMASRFFYVISLTIPVAKVGLAHSIKRTSALFATIIGGEVFHEKHLTERILACLVMLFGVYLILI